MGRTIVGIRDGVVASPGYAMSGPINLRIEEGEQIAVLGDKQFRKTGKSAMHRMIDA